MIIPSWVMVDADWRLHVKVTHSRTTRHMLMLTLFTKIVSYHTRLGSPPYRRKVWVYLKNNNKENIYCKPEIIQVPHPEKKVIQSSQSEGEKTILWKFTQNIASKEQINRANCKKETQKNWEEGEQVVVYFDAGFPPPLRRGVCDWPGAQFIHQSEVGPSFFFFVNTSFNLGCWHRACIFCKIDEGERVRDNNSFKYLLKYLMVN